MVRPHHAALAALLACLLGAAAPARGAGGCPFVSGGLGLRPINEIDETTPDAPKWKEPEYSEPSSCTAEQFEEIARDLITVATASANLPKLFRLGFHACATWSAAGLSGGCNGGWLKFAEDNENKGNSGLAGIVDALKKYQAEHPCITFADLITLGGAVGVEAAGGPPVAWYPGRRDALSAGPIYPSYSSRLPNAAFGAAGVSYYYVNLGLTNREAVALTGGGHSIGGADAAATGWNGTFTSFGDGWPTPSNLYFTDLVKNGWEYEVVEGTGRVQWKPLPGQAINYTAEDGTAVFRLPSDMALRESELFTFWSVAYAANETAFVNDFQRVMQRVLQLGAGHTWEIDTSYKWKGLDGKWEGYGPDMQPQSDYEDLPLANVDVEDLTGFYDNLDGPLADPSTSVTLDKLMAAEQ